MDSREAISALSPSGLSSSEPAHRLHEALLRELVDSGHERLGDAILAAQSRYVEGGGATELLSVFHLFGDPTLVLDPP